MSVWHGGLVACVARFISAWHGLLRTTCEVWTSSRACVSVRAIAVGACGQSLYVSVRANAVWAISLFVGDCCGSVRAIAAAHGASSRSQLSSPPLTCATAVRVCLKNPFM
jgi:hypothetical protein